jgi:hypothetical protein
VRWQAWTIFSTQGPRPWTIFSTRDHGLSLALRNIDYLQHSRPWTVLGAQDRWLFRVHGTAHFFSPFSLFNSLQFLTSRRVRKPDGPPASLKSVREKSFRAKRPRLRKLLLPRFRCRRLTVPVLMIVLKLQVCLTSSVVIYVADQIPQR